MVWQHEQRLSYEDFIEKHQVLVLGFLAVFALLSLRLFYLQIIKGAYYKTISEGQRTQVIMERAPRGIIYDRSGKIIVGNKNAFVALFYPFTQNVALPKELLGKLNKIFALKNLTLHISQGWRSGQVVRLAEDLTREEMFKIQEQRLLLPGISVVKESRRSYTMPEANSHVIGYLNEISKKELDAVRTEGYRSGDWVGRGGIEQVYDGMLRGQDGGWQIEVDASGRQTRLIQHILTKPGKNVFTTLDIALQDVAYKALEKSPSKRGAVIGIDPRSGAVRILVSCPGFNPEVSFSKEFNKYLIDNNLPLFNRAIQALYPPGSSFKVVTFSAALAENKTDPLQAFMCKGKFTLGDRIFGCWMKTGHGKVSLVQAMEESCNVYFYQLGLKIGPELLERYAKAFRLDKLTGIDLLGEKTGLVPNAKWKKEKLGLPWTQGDTVNMAIGQGSLWITPIEMAVMVTAAANKGVFYRPYIVDNLKNFQGELVYKAEIEEKSRVYLPDTVWDLLHTALRGVVKNGTAKSCYFKNLEVSGKTGTAQNPHGDDHSWFVGYAPSVNPELAIAVVVENGGSGGGIAAPIAREIFKAAFKEETQGEW